MQDNYAENSFTKESVVEWHCCDMRGELRPFSFMNMAQEIAGFHANKLGFGYYDLIKENTAWVLSRIKVKYITRPRWCDNVTLETWHKGMESLFGIRDFVLHNSDGSRAVVATSSWLIINYETHKIDRNNVFRSEKYLHTKNNEDNAIESSCGRIKRQSDVEYVRTHTVHYSDVDFLGHTNNAKYVEWIMDSVEPEFLKEHAVAQFQLNFNAETRLGDEVAVYGKRLLQPDGERNITFYFEGRRGDDVIFESEFVFEK